MKPALKSLLVAAALAMVLAACSEPVARSTSSPTSAPASGSTASAGGHGADGPSGEAAAFTPLVASVLAPPVPVPATDGKIHLAYELTITNFLSQDVTLTSVTALAGDVELTRLGGEELAGWLRVFGRAEPGTTFGPGQSGLLWVDVTVDDRAAVPASFAHTFEIDLSDPQPPNLLASMTQTGVAPIRVSDQAPVVLAAPLSGEGWLNGNGCCAGVTPHRGAVSPLNGALWAPERYAIDYVRLDADGRLFTGDRTQLSSYAYYGAEIRAVGAGKVVAVVDHLPEQVPGANPTGLTVAEYGGNHVVQDLGNGHYAFYAHLQPGAGVKVKVGDELATGAVVGLLGNSGNTDSPHLHFHLMDGPDPLASNGLPFVFESFTLTGRLAEPDAVDELTTTGGPVAMVPGVTPTDERHRMPLTLDVMTY